MTFALLNFMEWLFSWQCWNIREFSRFCSDVTDVFLYSFFQSFLSFSNIFFLTVFAINFLFITIDLFLVFLFCFAFPSWFCKVLEGLDPNLILSFFKIRKARSEVPFIQGTNCMSARTIPWVLERYLSSYMS